MLKLKREMDLRIVVAHVNHKVRVESDKEMQSRIAAMLIKRGNLKV